LGGVGGTRQGSARAGPVHFLRHQSLVKAVQYNDAQKLAREIEYFTAGEKVLMIDELHPDYRYSALWEAVNMKNPEMVDMLLKAGADANIGHVSGGGPLLRAAALGQEDIVQRLLDGGADLHERDSQGLTALQHAMGGGHVNVAQLLLARGASSSGLLYDGETSADVVLTDASPKMFSPPGLPCSAAQQGMPLQQGRASDPGGFSTSCSNSCGWSPAAMWRSTYNGAGPLPGMSSAAGGGGGVLSPSASALGGPSRHGCSNAILWGSSGQGGSAAPGQSDHGTPRGTPPISPVGAQLGCGSPRPDSIKPCPPANPRGPNERGSGRRPYGASDPSSGKQGVLLDVRMYASVKITRSSDGSLFCCIYQGSFA
jgi:hypothetical protein